MGFFNIPAEKIEVIYLASSIGEEETVAAEDMRLPARYILFVGARSAYKNFFFFLNGIRSVLENDPSLNVVCTGAPFNRSESMFLEQLYFKGRVHSFQANDAQLKVLYKRALIFVFPSLYEGFGLPVLEAFGCDCPALLSNASSLPEIGGSAALYFEPKNAKSLQSSVAALIYDEQLRADLTIRGRNQYQLFSWQKTCRETEAVYRDAFVMNLTI